MRKSLTKLAVVLACASLAGCSTNTQSENTGIGAVTGAVVGGLAGSAIGGGTGQAVAIGVGAVAGALLGGYIGHSMESSDHSQMYSVMDNNATNQPTSWTNARTGATYTLTPTSKKMTIHGNPDCRRFYTTAVMKGKKQQVHGVACRQADGAWQTVNP